MFLLRLLKKVYTEANSLHDPFIKKIKKISSRSSKNSTSQNKKNGYLSNYGNKNKSPNIELYEPNSILQKYKPNQGYKFRSLYRSSEKKEFDIKKK